MMTLMMVLNDARVIMSILPIIMILMIGGLFGWIYTVGSNLYRRLPQDTDLNLKRFQYLLLVPVVYMLGIIIYILFLANNGMANTLNPFVFLIVVPLHLFSMFCIFYGIYFMAKALKSVERNANVEVGDYIGEFFLLWFFPVGVWFIQPRINKLFGEPQNESLATADYLQ